ncbi:hypothetical protein ACN38_g10704, partial [Penicillium nordicum]
KCFKKAVIN